MNNIENYNLVFASTFNVEIDVLTDEFCSTSVDNWDSITQLSLVTAMEDTFDIMIDTEDILAFKSYAIGKDILSKNGVSF
jgi:acyl carrier protein